MDAAAPAPSIPPATSASVAPAAADIRRAEPVKAALPANAPNDTGKFYIVAKGDNPVKIAKKLKVSEAELLAANHIDDPRKLQIGQKLIVPASKSTKAKKSDD
jgi:LysM repeat protein